MSVGKWFLHLKNVHGCSCRQYQYPYMYYLIMVNTNYYM